MLDEREREKSGVKPGCEQGRKRESIASARLKRGYAKDFRSNGLTPEEVALFNRAKEGDRAAAGAILAAHEGMIKGAVGKHSYGFPFISRDDLLGMCRLKTWKLIGRFEPELGNLFSTYLGNSVHGWIKNAFRDHLKARYAVSRADAEGVIRYRNAVSELTPKLSRNPSMEEISKKLGVAIAKVHRWGAVERRIRATDSVERRRSWDNETAEDRVPAVRDEGFERFENAELLKQLISRAELQPLERRLLGKRFIERMSQTEIADELKLDRKKVSRTVIGALAKIRAASGIPEPAARHIKTKPG